MQESNSGKSKDGVGREGAKAKEEWGYCFLKVQESG